MPDVPPTLSPLVIFVNVFPCKSIIRQEFRSHFSIATPLNLGLEHIYRIMLRILNLYPNAATKADEDGNLPVHLAARHGYPQVLRKLLEHSSLVNDKNGYGWTPLMHAAANNQIDCVKFLLREGAKVNPKDKSNVSKVFPKWVVLLMVATHVTVLQICIQTSALKTLERCVLKMVTADTVL